MMKMKYKMTNKLNRGLDMGEDKNNHAPHTTNSSWKIPPKRVSLCSLMVRYSDSLEKNDTYSFNDPSLKSPIPTIKEFSILESPPLLKNNYDKGIPTQDASHRHFLPITASRRLSFTPEEFEVGPSSPPTMMMDDGMFVLVSPDTLTQAPVSIAATTARRGAAALISPRMSPDFTAAVFSERPINEVNTECSNSLPAALYLPTTEEQKAVCLLVALKNLKGPLVCTPPEQRRPRTAAKSAVARYGEDFHCGSFSDPELQESPQKQQPPKKKLKTAKKKRVTRAASVVSCDEDPVVVVFSPMPCSISDPPSSTTAGQRGLRMAMPDDHKELNSLHCFVRSELLELFVMDEYATSSKSSSKSSSASAGSKKRSRSAGPNCVPRVGLRCVYCGHLPRKNKESASMSIFFPKSLQDIYRSVCTWQRIHFKACPHVPQDLAEQYDYLKDTDRTRGKKPHWVNSAYHLGLRNIDEKRGGIAWDPEQQVEVL